MARKVVIPDGTNAPVNTSLDEVAASNIQKKDRESKRDDALTEEMMYGKQAYKRSLTATQQERDTRYARLHDFYHNRDVSMTWDINDETIAKQLFRIDIRTKEGTIQLVLSAVELQKYLRWV